MDAIGNLLVGLAMLYVALLILPFLMKRFGLGFIADPLIRLINTVFSFPLKAALAAIRNAREGRQPRGWTTEHRPRPPGDPRHAERGAAFDRGAGSDAAPAFGQGPPVARGRPGTSGRPGRQPRPG